MAGAVGCPYAQDHLLVRRWAEGHTHTGQSWAGFPKKPAHLLVFAQVPQVLQASWSHFLWGKEAQPRQYRL